MKKIISLLLCVLILISPVIGIADTDTAFGNDFEFIKGIGLVGENTLSSTPLTRIELARILYNIIFGNPEVHSEYYKDYYFTDVAAEDKNVAAVMKDAGIMSGDGFGRFMPDATVTYNQLIKTVISFLGYDYKAQLTGGYPSGYMILAAQMQILLPGNVDGNAHVTYSAVASVLKKALDAPMCVINDKVYEVLENENWLYHYMGIKTDYGIISGNYLANLYSDNPSAYDSIIFEGQQMKLSENCYNIHDYLGMKVRIYFTDSSTAQTVLYFESGINRTYTIMDKDIASASISKVSIYDGDGEFSYDIASDAEMIYNGSHLPTFTNEDVNPFDRLGLSGELKLIDNNNDNYIDYIVVSAYQTVLVGNFYNNVIYDFYNKISPISIENYKERNIDICNIFGEPVLPEKIVSGYCVNVLSNKQGDVKKIVITNDSINGVIDEITYAKGGKISSVKIKGVEIAVSASAQINTAGFDPSPGSNVKVYFDLLGNAAILDLVNCEGEKGKFGIAVKTATVGAIDQEKLIRIFAEDGKMYDYKIAKRVKINGVSASNEEEFLATLGADDRGNIERQLVIFKEENGVLKDVVFPTDPGTFNDSLYQFSTSGLTYVKGLENYGGKFTLSNDLKVFRIPDESQIDVEKFYTVTTAIPDGSFSSTKLYGTKKAGLEANIVVVKDNVRGEIATPPGVLDREPILMIEKISEVLDGEGESTFKVLCHTVNGYYYYKMYFYAKGDVLKAGCGGVLPEEGDILRTAHFYSNGDEVNWVKLLYDFSKDKPAISIPFNTLGSQEYYTYGTVVNKSGTTVKLKTYTAPGTPELGNFEVYNVGKSYFKVIELKENSKGEITISSSTADCIIDEATSPGKGSEILLYTRTDAGFAAFVINRK